MQAGPLIALVEQGTWRGERAAAAALAFLLPAAGLALFWPAGFWAFLALAAGAGVLALALRFPVGFSVGWLLLAGSTPEMWLGDITGGAAGIVALVKLLGLVMVGVCILRWGARADPFNPGLAFLAMGITGMAHGLHPNLTAAESLRTLVGSAAPYAFSFAALPRRWSRAVIRATQWLPALTVLACVPLALLGIRPLFRDVAALRLAALGHPAFLAGFALAAFHASLVELFRAGRARDLALLGLNALILVLTGARAPLLLAAAVGLVAMLAVPSPAFPLRRRAGLLLAMALAVPLLLVADRELSFLRLFSLLGGAQADSLSGREIIWPYFQAAFADSPWFGWGVGAGKVLIDPDSQVAHLLGTTAAHDEFLRIGVDGGIFGLSVLVLMFAFWAITRTARLPRAERAIMRLVFLAFAVHSLTDNTLIATTASVLFAWVSAVFARGAAADGAYADPNAREGLR